MLRSDASAWILITIGFLAILSPCAAADDPNLLSVQQILSAEFPLERVVECRYSPDGQSIALLSSKLSVPVAPMRYPLEITKIRLSLFDRKFMRRKVLNDENDFSHAAFSSDSKLCVLWGPRSRFAKIVSVGSLMVLDKIDFGDPLRAPTSIAFSKGDNGLYYANTDSTIDLYDIKLQSIKRIGDYSVQVGSTQEVRTIPHNTRILAMGSPNVVVFSPESGRTVHVFGFSSGIARIRCSADTSVIVSVHSEGPFASDPKFLVIWKGKDGDDASHMADARVLPSIYASVIKRNMEILDHAVSHNGKLYCLLSRDGLGIGRISEPQDINWVQLPSDVEPSLKNHYGHALTFSPVTDELLVLANGDTRLRVYRPKE